MKLNGMKTVRHQRGAVMTEVIIVGIYVLVPLFILTPLLGKYIDTRHKVESAARYASWERTAWFDKDSTTFKNATQNTNSAEKSQDEITHETQARVIKNRNIPIHSEQGVSADHEKLDSLSFFTNRDNNGNASYEPLFISVRGGSNGAGNEYIDHTVNSGDGEEVPGKFGEKIDEVIEMLGENTTFDLNSKGMYTSNIELNVEEPKWFKEFANVDVKFSRDHVLLTDGWGAGGLEHNEELVRGLTLAGYIMNSGLGDVIDGFQKAADNKFFKKVMPFAQDIAKDCLVLGKVDADEVPDEVLSADPPSSTNIGAALPKCD